jgi:hypothetical protein
METDSSFNRTDGFWVRARGTVGEKESRKKRPGTLFSRERWNESGLKEGCAYPVIAGRFVTRLDWIDSDGTIDVIL